MIKFVDMFSGIGGFREGLTRAGGFTCVGHCEIDKYANRSYNALFDTKGEWFIEDARKADPSTMPDFQLLCGGFPCQTFSIAGSRKGFGDPRGTLFFELARLAEARKPPYLLFENVVGLINHDHCRTFATILNTLDRLGYVVEWQCLNSKDFGVPQSRNRVYIIGYLDERCRGKVFPFTETAGSSLIQTHGGHQGERVYSPEGLSCTLAANPGGFGGKTGLYEVGVPIQCATKTGYQMAQVGDSIDLSYATVNSRRGRVGKEIAHGVNLAYCSASFSLGPMNRTIQSVPALMRCTMQITVGQYLLRFLLAKWAGAFVMGLWVMLAALIAKRAATGWIGTLALPLAMYGIRTAIPATSHLNVIKYANMVSLLQTNELLGNYRNLFWFGSPISLPMVEWVTAAALGSVLSVAFCTVFTKAQLLPAAKRSLALPFRHKTHATSVTREEGRKLLLMNGAAVFLAAFLAFGIYQGVTAESYIDADEIYYAYYMKHISGPWSEESRDWLKDQRNEFAPMLEAQKRVNRGELSSEALLAYNSLQQKYSAFQRVLQSNISYYLKENPGAWLVYETGYKKLFGFTGTSDVQDTLLAGLLCALCFSGLFAMERKGGMDEILASTPLGRKYTVKAKLWQSTAVAAVIAFGTVLPHLWQVLRDYGLPSLLGPAMSISDLQAVPKFITLSDLLIFWLICRFAACLCMSRITLWLGQKLGNLLTALFISAVAYCLPALLSLSGMKNGIEWLGFYPLFHAAALWQNQGYNANGESYNAMWIPIFLVCTAFFLAWAIGQALIDDYDMIGVPDEVL